MVAVADRQSVRDTAMTIGSRTSTPRNEVPCAPQSLILQELKNMTAVRTMVDPNPVNRVPPHPGCVELVMRRALSWDSPLEPGDRRRPGAREAVAGTPWLLSSSAGRSRIGRPEVP